MKPLRLSSDIFYTVTGFFFIFFGFDGAQQYFLPLLKVHGKENLALQSLILLYGLFFLASFFAASLVTKLGSRTAFIVGCLGYFLFTISVVTGWAPAIYLGSTIAGIAGALVWNASGRVVVNASLPEETGKNLGLQYSALLLGGVLGSTVGALLLNQISLESLFAIYSGAIVIGILCLAGISRAPEKTVTTKVSSANLQKRLLPLFPLIFAGYFILIQGIAALNLVVLSAFGLGAVGTFSILFRLSATVGGIGNGKISDVMSKPNLLRLLSLFGLGGIGLTLFTHQKITLGIAVILLGLFASVNYPVTLSFLRTRVSDKEYTQALATFHIFSTIGMISALAATYILEPRWSYFPAIVAIIISFPALLLFERQNPLLH